MLLFICVKKTIIKFNGFDKKGRPTSITLLGNLYEEAVLLAVAKQFQVQTNFEEKHPPQFK